MIGPFTPGLLSRLPEPPRKVALIRASRIGDFICATPAFRALRRAMPDAEVTLIGLPLVRTLVKRSPYIDRFEAFPGFPGMAEQFFDSAEAVRFFRRMQTEQFDLAVQMHGSGVYSNPFTLMLGARLAVGFVRDGDPAGRLDAALPVPEDRHEVQRTLALTTFLGAPPHGEETEFPLLPGDHAAAIVLLASAKPPLIGLHFGARERTKRWPLERFAAAGAALLSRYDGTLVILGASEDQQLARSLAETVNGSSLNLAGCMSLGTLGAVIARLALLITNDSGPAHIAYALRTPTITIFGGTDPARWGPPEDARHAVLACPVPCRPCDYAECPVGYVCLNGITVEQVVAAAEQVMP